MRIDMPLSHYMNPRKFAHKKNVLAFIRIEKEFDLGWFLPAPDKAPWHVQAVLKSQGGQPIVLNFYPCALTAYREGEPTAEGAGAIRALIRRAMDDAANPDFDIELIED
jgi:hypothetical protein